MRSHAYERSIYFCSCSSHAYERTNLLFFIARTRTSARREHAMMRSRANERQGGGKKVRSHAYERKNAVGKCARTRTSQAQEAKSIRSHAYERLGARYKKGRLRARCRAKATKPSKKLRAKTTWKLLIAKARSRTYERQNLAVFYSSHAYERQGFGA